MINGQISKSRSWSLATAELSDMAKESLTLLPSIQTYKTKSETNLSQACQCDFESNVILQSAEVPISCQFLQQSMPK